MDRKIPTNRRDNTEVIVKGVPSYEHFDTNPIQDQSANRSAMELLTGLITFPLIGGSIPKIASKIQQGYNSMSNAGKLILSGIDSAYLSNSINNFIDKPSIYEGINIGLGVLPFIQPIARPLKYKIRKPSNTGNLASLSDKQISERKLHNIKNYPAEDLNNPEFTEIKNQALLDYGKQNGLQLHGQTMYGFEPRIVGTYETYKPNLKRSSMKRRFRQLDKTKNLTGDVSGAITETFAKEKGIKPQWGVNQQEIQKEVGSRGKAVDDLVLRTVENHEKDHMIFDVVSGDPEFFKAFKYEPGNPISEYFFSNGGTELLTRFGQLKDYAGLRKGQKYTLDMLKNAIRNYPKFIDNGMTEFFQSITDKRKATELIGKYGLVLTGINHLTKENNATD